jgi:O-antigen/teichoic acid export membrane protein
MHSEGFAISDQALFYGANFAVNILLARWLKTSAYGAFAVSLSVFYLAGGLHTAVLTEPMMVFGARKYNREYRRYLGLLLKFHWPLALVTAIFMGAAGLVVELAGSHEMAMALWGVAIASPFILLAWFIRPASYVCHEAQWAALGSAVYAGLMVAGLWLLREMGLLSAASAFVVMGIASIVGALITAIMLRPRWNARESGTVTVRDVLDDHRSYGSWNAVATVTQWSSGQILFVLTPIFLDLKAAAAIGVATTLMRPLFPMIRSITLLMLPRVSIEIVNSGDRHGLRRYVRNWLFMCAGGALCYAIGISAFYEPISHHLLGDKYHGYAAVVFLFGLAYTASAAIQVLSVVIRAAEATRLIAMIWALPGVVTIVLAFPALIERSLLGVASVFAFSYIVALALAAQKSSLLMSDSANDEYAAEERDLEGESSVSGRLASRP